MIWKGGSGSGRDGVRGALYGLLSSLLVDYGERLASGSVDVILSDTHSPSTKVSGIPSFCPGNPPLLQQSHRHRTVGEERTLPVTSAPSQKGELNPFENSSI